MSDGSVVELFPGRGGEPADPLAGLVGESAAMRRLKAMLPRVAHSPATTVLITGESGTGKDVVAHALHRLSPRHRAEFVNITCSALPGQLLESELFGHERGAFTDAKERKIGLLERAHGGTVFLDEIGELELGLQVKLLRFLEDHTFRRVGGTAEVHADVRVVAATNANLRDAIAEHRFREDLYYRLAVVTLGLPPLRDREGDVELLLHHFLAHYDRSLGRDVRTLTPRALRLLRSHPWPGNIRELRNAVERAVLLALGTGLDADDFDFLEQTAVDHPIVHLPAGGVDILDVERSLVEQALDRTNGNQSKAAELLRMTRDQFRYRMRRHNLLP